MKIKDIELIQLSPNFFVDNCNHCKKKYNFYISTHFRILVEQQFRKY